MRSLRGRLTLGVTVVLAAVLVLAGWLAARDVDRSEREALDDRLIRTAELSGATALEAVQQELPSADDRLDAVLSATRTSLRLTLGDAALVETGDPAPRHGRLPKGLPALEGRRARLRNRLLLIGLLALLIAAAGVFAAGGVVLRPLGRLRAATARIAGEEDLDQRVPAD